ncbi:MAG: secretin N-terminal domain-containing protein [Gemmatimonadaceae bacterium]|nr:secretin N-terminal domain-containing protein [Gemmatimonadaceae bacterium]
MMNRMHVSSLRSGCGAAAAGVAVFAAIAALPSNSTAQALVQGVRVESNTAGTVVAVTLTDSVARSAFTLAGPNRIVLDLPGATLGALGGRAYDGQPRGPVQNIRMAQYRSDIVRVVIDVDGAARYSLSGGNEVRIALAGGTETAAWSTGESMPSRRTEVADAQEVTAVAVMDSTVSSARANAGETFSQVAYQTPEAPTIGSPAMSRGKPPKPRITVSYQEADIRDVIAAFASFANRTIIVGRDVTGSITADVKDKPWDEALAAILSAQGLAASEEPNGIIIVDSYKNMLDKQSLEPLITQVVSVNYANATSLATTVRGLLTRDCVPGAGGPTVGGAAVTTPGAVPAGCVVRGSVQADSATNSLLIREVQSRMDDVISYVRSIDRRTPQVAIKAKIIFVNRTTLQEMGITYDIGTARQFFNTVIPRQEVVSQVPIDRNGDGVPDAFRQVQQPVIGDRVDFGGNTVSAIANANSNISSPALNLIFSAAMGKYSLTPFIQALQESSLADVQAEPTVVTLDNRKAEILVGQEIPIRVLDAGAGAGAGAPGQINIPRATVQLKEVGISLSVTPRITNNRQIMMTIHAENSSASLASSDVGFIFDKQRADNTLMVPDGETAVIGGLTITSVSKSRRGVPYLMDIPYIGRLFSTTRKNEQKRDLVILVSPHILDDGEARTPAPNPGR